jgi:SAM-dependent methyltransferase
MKGPAYYYVHAKLARDPVARRVAELAGEEPLGEVLDAGCGRGQLALLLLSEGLATHVTGFDWDARKVATAALAAGVEPALSATFRVADLRAPLCVDADTTLLIDVLHYLRDDEQDGVLREVARRTRRLVVVRELDPDRGWRSFVTTAEEGFTTRLGYNRGARVNARPVAALVRTLEAEGFSVEVTPCWGATPFSNVLIVARRRVGGTSESDAGRGALEPAVAPPLDP